jgi:hypothetical protein
MLSPFRGDGRFCLDHSSLRQASHQVRLAVSGTGEFRGDSASARKVCPQSAIGYAASDVLAIRSIGVSMGALINRSNQHGSTLLNCFEKAEQIDEFFSGFFSNARHHFPFKYSDAYLWWNAVFAIFYSR